MNFEAYLKYFEHVLQDPSVDPTYQNEEYYNYTKLNWSRMTRWLKKFEPSQAAKNFISSIDSPQTWIIITEPWCGDAAHSVPQLYNLAKQNPLITVDVQLRDSEPFLINDYLTNGGKSIPKLIIRDANNNDIAVWGPRPDQLQEAFLKLKEQGKDMGEIKEVVQKWYNVDKGIEIQKEILNLLSK